MSRWLWALLGGVVLVAIAAAFWTDQQPDECLAPGFAGANSCRSRARSRLYRAEIRALGSVLTFRPGLRRTRPRPVHTCGAGRAAGRNPARRRAAPCPWRAPGSARRAGCSRSAPCRS